MGVWTVNFTIGRPFRHPWLDDYDQVAIYKKALESYNIKKRIGAG
jgi:hypothetical protein